MEPIGSITIYFSYVDDETKGILISTMAEAKNFNDFTEKFCDFVLTNDTPQIAQYLNCFFALMFDKAPLLTKIMKENRIPPIAKPYRLLLGYLIGDVVSWEEMVRGVREALSFAPNDWFVCHLYLMWSLLAVYLPVYPASDFDLHPYDSVINDIQSNDELEYFRAMLYWIDAFKLEKEFKMTEVAVLIDGAIQIFQQYDDSISEMAALLHSSQALKHTNLERAIDHVLKAKRLCEIHGYAHGIGLVQHILSHIMGMRGEYDAAIDHQLQYREFLVSNDVSLDFVDAILALYHNQAGNYEEALDYVKDIEITDKVPARLAAHFQTQKTWSLIMLRREKEVRRELEKAKAISMKSGDLGFLFRVEVLDGLVEKVEHRYDNAIAIFSKLYESFSTNPIPMYENICLLNLVELEIALQDENSIDTKADVSGPWMKTIEEHCRKQDMPGVAAQAKLFKAKFREKQQRPQEADSYVNEVLQISESPSMRFLKNRVKELFPHLSAI